MRFNRAVNRVGVLKMVASEPSDLANFAYNEQLQLNHTPLLLGKTLIQVASIIHQVRQRVVCLAKTPPE